MADLAELTRDERLALIDLLEGLDEHEWTTPSLCEGWTVQDVAAHLAWAPVLSPARTLTELGRARLSVNRMIADTAKRDAARGPAAIITQLRSNAQSGAKPMGMPRVASLADAVVHQLDIRRPLGRPRTIPPEAFRRAATFFAGTGFPGSVVVGGNVRRRVAGLRLVADDVDWSHGEGPEVRGSSEALMLMLAGRPVPDDALTGPGAADLSSRIGVS